ncbi:XRCC4 [Mytilus edulis]|uniref:XRCC4 n=1 Tax=Mytilus edulis TaxID=6550 RepID=A0A8S3S655_MYTED|nr:XRCC4 [Mytilus edulis]
MKSLVKLDLLDGNGCFLQTDYQDDGKSGFKLTLIDGIDVWKGQVSEDDLDNLRLAIKMDLNTFTRQTLQALTKSGGKDIVFNYQVKHKKDNSLELIWKKHVPAEDITFQLGRATLKSSTSATDAISSVLNYCIECAKSQQVDIATLQTDNDRLSQERVNALKFAAILNSKKEKIRELKESGGVAVNNGDAGPSRTPTTQSTKRPAKQMNYSDDENTTDDEKVTQHSKKAKQSNRSMDDDSLVLEDENEDKPKTVARPRRTRETNKKTPNKPVLPKVSSKDSNTSLSERPSTSRSSERPSSTRKSRASSGNTYDNDADAMLDEI